MTFAASRQLEVPAGMNKVRVTAFIITSFALLVKASPNDARHISYESFKFGKAYYHAVTADLRFSEVSAGAVHSKRLTNVRNLIDMAQPTVAITGTFFAPGCERPVADVLVDGQLVAQGRRGSVIAVDWFGKVHIFDSGWNEKLDWFGYRYALRGTVRLIRDGVISPNPKAQKFRDSRIWGRAARSAAGITSDGQLILVVTPNSVTLSELGKALKSRGAVNAVSLDGGGSTMMYYRGSYVVSVHRKLSNLLVVRERTDGGVVAQSPTAPAVASPGAQPVQIIRPR